MGGPDRQTTPRTNLDDFVAGLLQYGTLGYLPQSIMSQLFPPIPGVTGPPGTPNGPGPFNPPMVPPPGGGPPPVVPPPGPPQDYVPPPPPPPPLPPPPGVGGGGIGGGGVFTPNSVTPGGFAPTLPNRSLLGGLSGGIPNTVFRTRDPGVDTAVPSGAPPPAPGVGGSLPLTLPPGVGQPSPFSVQGQVMGGFRPQDQVTQQLLGSAPLGTPGISANSILLQPPPPPPNPPASGLPSAPADVPSGALPFDIGRFIQGRLSLPQYQGQMTAGANPLQMSAALASLSGLGQINPNVGNNVLSQLFSMGQPGQGAGTTGPLAQLLSGFANQPGAGGLASLLSGGGPGSSLINQAAGQNVGASSPLNSLLGSQPAAMQQSLLTMLGMNNPAVGAQAGLDRLGSGQPTGMIQQLLTQLGISQPGGQQQNLLTALGLSNPTAGAQGILAGQLGGPNQNEQLASLLGLSAAGGTPGEATAQNALAGLAGGQDLSSLFSSLDAARQQGLSRDLGNIREQFSAGGAGLSTGLARELANRQTQSERDFMSQLGQLGLASAQNRAGAATALGGLAGAAPGRQANVAQILGQLGGQTAGREVNIGSILGQLGLGGAGAQQQAILGAGQLGLGGAGAQQSALSSVGQLAQGDVAGQLQALLGSGQLGLGTTEAQRAALTSAGQLGLGTQQNQLGAAQGLTQAQLADAQRQLEAGTSQQGTSLQAASTLGGQGINQADILRQLLQGNQATSLQALLGTPGAYQSLLQAPQQAAASAGSIGEALRQIQQSGLTAQQQEFTRTSGGLFPLLLQYAAGAPQIYTPGIGQQAIGAGSTLGAAALGGK